MPEFEGKNKKSSQTADQILKPSQYELIHLGMFWICSFYQELSQSIVLFNQYCHREKVSQVPDLFRGVI